MVQAMCEQARVVKPFFRIAPNGLISSKKLTDALLGMFEEGQHSTL
jgi:hypothetical protein